VTATPGNAADVALPTLADVYVARDRLQPFLRPTPLLAVPALAEHLGLDVRLKLESLQPIGAFKVRGGISLVAAIEAGAEPRPRGFLTASTGNHGQSIAYAARLFGYSAVVYAPVGSNPYKVAAMRRLGAEVVLAGADFEAAREAAEAAAPGLGYRYVHAADEPLLYPGVGTAMLEVIEEWPSVDAVVLPLGGGSFACGTCLAGKGITPGLVVIAAQSAGAPAFYRSWLSGRVESTPQADTFADGLATRQAYAVPLRLLRGSLDDVALVTDAELRQAMVALLRHAHVLAEPAAAAPVAALAQPAVRERLAGRRVAILISGGNVTPETLRDVLAAELAAG
jgi:threonine dehydratase